MFCNEIPTKNKKRLAHYSTKTLIHFLSRSTSTPIKNLHPPIVLNVHYFTTGIMKERQAPK